MAPEEPRFSELARQALEQHKDRRSMEWRVNIAFWTPIVLFIWYLLRDEETLINGESGSYLFYCYSLLLGCLWGIYTWLHQVSKQRANRLDTDWKHWWIQCEVKGDKEAAQRKKDDELTVPSSTGSFSKEEWDKDVTKSMWFWSQTLFTTVIMAFSWLVFFFRTSTNRYPPDTALAVILLITPAVYFWWRWWYYEYADACDPKEDEKTKEPQKPGKSAGRIIRLRDFLCRPLWMSFLDYLIKLLSDSFLSFWHQVIVVLVLLVFGLGAIVLHNWAVLSRSLPEWVCANWLWFVPIVIFLLALLLLPRKDK